MHKPFLPLSSLYISSPYLVSACKIHQENLRNEAEAESQGVSVRGYLPQIE